MRCKVLENMLQNALGEAKQVWVIGDVHGCAIELENLLTKLDLKSGDHALLVGDLIDRGPDSARVVDLVRSSDNLHTIKGNHEQMMISGFVEKFGRGGPSMETMLWLSNGGLDTIKSFDRMYDDGNSRLEETSTWFRSLPSQVILDGFRIVHAGFTPDVSMREQTDDSMLWIRNIFFDHPKPLDEQRQIIEAARAQLIECLNKADQILVRLDVANVQHEPVVELVAFSDPRDGFVRRRDAKSLVDRVVHHDDLFRWNIQQADDVALGGLRDGENSVRAPGRGPRGRLRVQIRGTVW